MAERLYNITHREKIAHAALKSRIAQPAVGYVGKGNAVAAQDLSCRKQSALGIAQTDAVRFRALVQRSPEQDRHAHILGKPGTEVFRAKIAVRQEQSVDFFPFEFLGDL
ncbi:hypothetical protein SDC9_99733 [bioreactor metagenome]|uniref:Uncharacterized protein n=1 Tax=bioreactor metagenome TaxID=1076179 RepID=A0A645AIH5_9ZZZZ